MYIVLLFYIKAHYKVEEITLQVSFIYNFKYADWVMKYKPMKLIIYNYLNGRKNMLVPMVFTSQIILLIIGFGAGYLLLITAKGQEYKLKNIGEALGWALIALTIFLSIVNFVYSIKIANNYDREKYCPINKTTPAQPETNTTINQDESGEEGVQDDQEIPSGQGNVQDVPPTTDNRPIKRDIKDHE